MISINFKLTFSYLYWYQLLKLVEKFGTLVEFDFLYHRSGPLNGQPRGYAFITYNNLDSARKAQSSLDGIEICNKKLAVKWAHAQDEVSNYIVPSFKLLKYFSL